MKKIPEKYDQPQIHKKTYKTVTSIHKTEPKNGKGATYWEIGRAPRASHPKWLTSQCKMMKFGEEWDEKVEEKRERQWRGWLGFGSGEGLHNKWVNAPLL